MSESEEFVFSLYNSQICRLCGEHNPNGYPLYKVEDIEDEALSQKINTYLPLRISDDGIYPRWICPGCHLQVESTVQFFTLILSGQDILRMLYREEQQKTKVESISSVDDAAEKNDDAVIVFEMPEFLYPSDHELAQTAAPVKRKRGRPRKSEKPKPEDDDVESSVTNEDHQNEQHPTYTGRLKRRIKVPSRYQEAVKGRELEKVFVDMGLEDKDKIALDSVDSTLNPKDSKAVVSEELIGHVQDDKGINLGDLIAVSVDGKGKRLKQSGAQKTKTRFMCDICKVCFWHEQRFLQHRFSHHLVSFECIQCLKSFKDRKYLTQHQMEESHSGEGLIEDPATDSEPAQQLERIDDGQINYLSADTAQNVLIKFVGFEEVDEMDSTVKLHLDLKGNEYSKDGILCTQAPPEISQEEANTAATFEEEKSLESSQNDIDLASVDKFTCKQCKQDFVEFNAYIEHKKNEHSVGRRFICSKCRRTFTTKTLLRRHQVVHSEARPHICTICSAAFKTKTNLINHQVKHNNSRRFSCKVCDQKFVHKHSLKLHLRVHSGSKPFKCPQCGKGFNQHGNMQEHMRVHTGERPFQCTICPKSFKTSSQCRIHIKRHEIDRPLKCSKCEKSFLSMEELKVHERRHENIKPYKCNHCDKSFIDMPALRKHTRLHTGEKPFGCPECGRHFADRSNLNKHQKLHESKRKNNDLLLSQDEQISGDGTPGADLTSNSFDTNSLIFCDVNAPGDESVWNVIEDCITNPAKLDENEPLIKPDDAAAAKQVVYVTYQDPNNPVDNKTTLYVVE